MTALSEREPNTTPAPQSGDVSAVELGSAPPSRSESAADTARWVALSDVADERERQDAVWGGVPGIQRRDDHTYAAVLGEEFGEACQAWLQRDPDALRFELVQVAAVAVAWIEELDNGGNRERA